MKYRHLVATISVVASFAFCLIISPSADAKTFNPGNIIDDSIFTNKNTMTAEQIQTFFNAKGAYCTNGEAPCLKNYSEGGRSAAQIIYDTSQQFNINPQTLIVTLQKEVGLVTLSKPAAWRYRTAMGYGCPDSTPGVCDSSYYGFTNQVTWAARMFRAIMNASPTWYTPYILGNNYIQYNPAASCGGSNVYIQNRATQALYNYTPYQPNDASLAAGYGTAPCGAYGNRNFWLYFNDWFGSTSGGDITVAYKESGSPQYVINDNKKYLIPDVPTKIAWNLHLLPDTPLPDVVVDSMPFGGVLGRYVQSNYTGQRYFIDGQRRYPASQSDLANYTSEAPVSVSRYLIDYLIDGPSFLSPFVSRPDGSVYVVDGGLLRRLPSSSVVSIWRGSSYATIAISDSLFNEMPKGSDINEYKIKINDKTYLLDNGLYTPFGDGVSKSFPGAETTITTKLLATMRPSGKQPMGNLIQSYSSGIVYYANGSERLAVPTMSQLLSYSPRGLLTISYISDSIMNQFSVSSILSGHTVTNSGNTYIIDSGYKRLISPDVVNDFVSPTDINSLPKIDTSRFPDGNPINETFTRVSDGRVMIANGGSLYYIPDLVSYVLWGGEYRQGTSLPAYVIDWIPQNGTISNTFTVNGTSYLMTDRGQAREMSLPLTKLFKNTQTLARLPQKVTITSGAPLERKLLLNDGSGCVLNEEGAFCSNNKNMISVWNISTSQPTISPLSLGHLPRYPLTQFVESRTVSEVGISLKTKNATYHLKTPGQVYNAGWYGQKRVVIDADDLASSPLVTDWDNLLTQSPSGAYYVINNGVAYPVAGSLAQTWGTKPAQLTNEDLAVIPQSRSAMTSSFQRNGDSRVLTIRNGKVSWVRSLGSYSQSYFPLTPVSGYFAEQLPSDTDIE